MDHISVPYLSFHGIDGKITKDTAKSPVALEGKVYEYTIYKIGGLYQAFFAEGYKIEKDFRYFLSYEQAVLACEKDLDKQIRDLKSLYHKVYEKEEDKLFFAYKENGYSEIVTFPTEFQRDTFISNQTPGWWESISLKEVNDLEHYTASISTVEKYITDYNLHPNFCKERKV